MPYIGNTTTSFNVDSNNINNGSITTEKIAAGAVVNADVNDSASIAGTKISADFGAQDLIVDTNLLFVDVSEDRVGIGTSSPGAPLTVSNSGNNKLTLTGGANQNGLTFDGANGSDSYYIYTSSLGLNFYNTTDSVSALTIDNSNRVGVGTTSPAEKLQVGSGGSGAQWLRVFGSKSNIYIGQTDGNIFGFGNGNGQFVYATTAEPFGIGTSGAQPVVLGTNATERLRIDSSGRVGIGTSSPSAKLTIHSPTSTEEGFRVIQTTADRTSGAALALVYDDRAGSTSPALKVIQNGTGDILQLYDGGTARFIVKDGGNVGIGTTSPATRLTLDGGDLKLTTASSTTRRVFALGGTGGYTLGTSGGAAIAFIRDGSNNDSIAFETHVQGSSHAERVRILSDGTLRLLNSPGIDFSQIQTNAGGMTSELLDSYEEGTWTFSISASSGTITTSSGSGRYVKIGRLVTVHFIITISNVGTANGAYLNFGNLPFTSSNTHNQPGVCREQSINGFLSTAQVTGNATTGQILRYDNSGVIVNGGNYQCTITYEAQ